MRYFWLEVYNFVFKNVIKRSNFFSLESINRLSYNNNILILTHSMLFHGNIFVLKQPLFKECYLSKPKKSAFTNFKDTSELEEELNCVEKVENKKWCRCGKWKGIEISGKVIGPYQAKLVRQNFRHKGYFS